MFLGLEDFVKKSVVFAALFTAASVAQVSVDLTGDLVSAGSWMAGPSLNTYNNTESKWQVIGWRFTTPSLKWEKLTGQDATDKYGIPLAKVVETPDGFLHEGRFARPDQYLMAPNGTSPITGAKLDYAGGTFAAGLDGTPSNRSVQIKLHERGTPPLPSAGHAPVPVSSLESYISSNSTYYNADYRYKDTLGIRGGTWSGGFFDTYGDETQAILPMTGDTFTLSMTPVVFEPSITGGPIYWMALSAMQEYLAEDYQFQMAIGFKETMAALASNAPKNPYVDGNKWDNSDNAFGPFEVEKYTYVSQAMYYPNLYPKYRKYLAEAGSEGQFAMAAFGSSEGVLTFTSEYCGPIKGTALNSPYVIGCMMGSYGTFQRIYDILSNAQRICLKEMLEKGQDRRIAVAALAVMYNRGITAPDAGTGITVDSAFDVSVYKNYLNDPNANEKLPIGNSDYRHHILDNCHMITNWTDKAIADKSIPIFDVNITLDDIKSFFFGEGGDVSKQGGGGWCNHYEVDRAALWAELQASYAILAKHWGGDHISYRYDWITLMRTVKHHFPLVRSQRPTSTESAIWMSTRDLKEGDCGCDDKIVDETAPSTKVLAIKTGSTSIVQMGGIDSVAGVKRLIWSADRSWDLWHDGIFNTGTVQNGAWIAEIPSAQASAGDTVWVGLVDSAGNADIREVVLKDFGQVGTEKSISPVVQGVSISMQGNALVLNGVVPGSVSLKLCDLRGRELVSLQSESVAGTAQFALPDVARGSYLLSIKTASQHRDVRLVR